MNSKGLGRVKVGSLNDKKFVIGFIGTNREKMIMITAYIFAEKVYGYLNLSKCDNELVENALWKIDVETFAYILNDSGVLFDVLSELIVLNEWNADFDIETLSLYTDSSTHIKMTTVNKLEIDSFLDSLWCLSSNERKTTLDNMILMSLLGSINRLF